MVNFEVGIIPLTHQLALNLSAPVVIEFLNVSFIHPIICCSC
jgi:hypothetical protein